MSSNCHLRSLPLESASWTGFVGRLAVFYIFLAKHNVVFFPKRPLSVRLFVQPSAFRSQPLTKMNRRSPVLVLIENLTEARQKICWPIRKCRRRQLCAKSGRGPNLLIFLAATLKIKHVLSADGTYIRK